MRIRSGPTLYFLVTVCALRASHAAEFTLNVTADGSSTYYEYYSEGFARIDLRDPPPDEFRQRIHLISDPSVAFGPLDSFPNDEAMRFGTISYDESSLIAGTGTATVTDMTIGLVADPFDPTYENWRRFESSTEVAGFSGTVDLVDGAIASFDLTIDVAIHIPSFLGATIEGVYPGQLILSRDLFTLDVESSPFLDPIFDPAGTNVHLQWAWSGSIDGVVYAVPGDLDGDDFVGQDDLNIILGAWGEDVVVGSTADPSKDGFVGQDDLNIVLAGWGKGTPPEVVTAVAVPEISSNLLLPLLFVCLALVRSRRQSVA